MDTSTISLSYKDRSRIITIFGYLLLLGGIAFGFLGPLEMYCFYLFSEGGRFYYPGFRFGSFMFGNIVAQITGYYLLAVVFILLGYAHIQRKRWARTLALAWLWSWLVIGAPLVVVVAVILLGTKSLSFPLAMTMLVFLGLLYFVFPGVLIRWYRGENVRRTLESTAAGTCWLDDLPVPILVLSSLYLFFTVMLHILILFNGIFPVFGNFRYGLMGIVLLDLSMVCLIVMAWGTLQRRVWAWWLSVSWLSLFLISSLITFYRASYISLLSGLQLPAIEMDFLDGIPVQGYHFALLVGVPLSVTLLIAIISRRHFNSEKQFEQAGTKRGS